MYVHESRFKVNELVDGRVPLVSGMNDAWGVFCFVSTIYDGNLLSNDVVRCIVENTGEVMKMIVCLNLLFVRDIFYLGVIFIIFFLLKLQRVHSQTIICRNSIMIGNVCSLCIQRNPVKSEPDVEKILKYLLDYVICIPINNCMNKISTIKRFDGLVWFAGILHFVDEWKEMLCMLCRYEYLLIHEQDKLKCLFSRLFDLPIQIANGVLYKLYECCMIFQRCLPIMRNFSKKKSLWKVNVCEKNEKR